MEGSGVLGRRQLRSVYLVMFRGIYTGNDNLRASEPCEPWEFRI